MTAAVADAAVEVAPLTVAPLYTTSTLADRLAVTPNVIRQMLHRGQLPPVVRIGRRIRWDANDIEAWIATQKEK
ncbi:helix-turn-helix domain-containing protein [Gordonia sp. (in: high G+C Gram-positive bacteria)]|uniref:helix-turn-helix transcriptional regulator n=1 Tax=Gordonia sp. (in: high G+C Gram-positive bacteria) TaxID=84139 RepID=UPI003340855C